MWSPDHPMLVLLPLFLLTCTFPQFVSGCVGIAIDLSHNLIATFCMELRDSIEDIFLLSIGLFYFWTPWTEQRIHYDNLVNELWGAEIA